MANTVYTVYEYVLDDGTTITLKPATIKTMRAFNAILVNGPSELSEDTKDEEVEDAGFKWILDMVLVLLKKQRPDLTQEQAEDLFDLETAYKVIEVCGGVKLNDPKLMAAAQAAANQA